MPIKVRYDVFDGIRKAPVYTTYDHRLAVIERDDYIRKGKGVYGIRATVIPDNMNKSEQFLYLVYEVRQLQRRYFDHGRDQEVFKQAIEKEKQLDDWIARISSFLDAHPNYKPADAKSHAFFLIVVRWRRLWKNYFAYKRRSDADPAIVRERGKECRDYEAQIDKYIKETIGL